MTHKRKSMLLLLALSMVTGCTQSKRMDLGILGEGLGRGPDTLEAESSAFTELTKVDLLPQRNWQDREVGLWGVDPGQIDDVAQVLGGQLTEDGRVVLRLRGDGCYRLSVGYGRASGSISTGNVGFELVGLVAAGLVDNNDEFRWTRRVEERLPVSGVVQGVSLPVGNLGYEVVQSGSEVTGVVFGDYNWAHIAVSLNRTSSSLGGIRTDGITIPIRVTVRVDKWVPVFSWSEASAVVGLSDLVGASHDCLGVKVEWIGTGTPSWLR